MPAFGFGTGVGKMFANSCFEILFAADVGVDGGQAERIWVVLQGIVEGEWFFIADFGENSRGFWQPAVAVALRFFVRWNGFQGMLAGKLLALFLGREIAEPDDGVEAVAEIRGVDLGVDFRFGRNVGNLLIEPFLAQPGVESAVAVMVGVAEVKAVAGHGVDEFPEASTQLKVVELGRRVGFKVEASKNLTGGNPLAIVKRINLFVWAGHGLGASRNFVELKFHLRNIFLLGGRFEERFFFEPKHSCDEDGGKCLYGGVELRDRVVVGLTRKSNAILGGTEFALEREEILVCLQIGIGFGDGHQSRQRAAQFAFGFYFVGGEGDAGGFGAGVDDGFERTFFVGGVAFDRTDQIGNEVVAALELDVDLRPGIFDRLTKANQRVVSSHQPKADEQYESDQNDKNYKCGTHVGTLKL